MSNKNKKRNKGLFKPVFSIGNEGGGVIRAKFIREDQRPAGWPEGVGYFETEDMTSYMDNKPPKATLLLLLYRWIWLKGITDVSTFCEVIRDYVSKSTYNLLDQGFQFQILIDDVWGSEAQQPQFPRYEKQPAPKEFQVEEFQDRILDARAEDQEGRKRKKGTEEVAQPKPEPGYIGTWDKIAELGAKKYRRANYDSKSLDDAMKRSFGEKSFKTRNWDDYMKDRETQVKKRAAVAEKIAKELHDNGGFELPGKSHETFNVKLKYYDPKDFYTKTGALNDIAEKAKQAESEYQAELDANQAAMAQAKLEADAKAHFDMWKATQFGYE